MNACTRVVSTGLVSLAFVPGLAAQPCTPHWAEPFPNAPTLNGSIRDLATFDEGGGPRLFATGYFTQLGTEPLKGIARWNGTRWESVGGGLSGVGLWMDVLDDGSGPALYVGGSFTTAGGAPASGIARWDGLTWSALGAGVSGGSIRGAIVFDDGSGPAIYVAGRFSGVPGVPGTAGIARFRPSTGQWSSVGGGLQIGVAPEDGAKAIGVYDLGSGPALYVAGQFAYAGNVEVNNIARWDGVAWTPVHGGVYGNDPLVMQMTMFDDGAGERLVIAGRFSYSPTATQTARVAALGPGGWEQIGPDLSDIWSDYVMALTVADGPSGPTLYVGGRFFGMSWLPGVRYVARLSGANWVGLEGGMNYPVRSLLAVEQSGAQVIYAGGEFSEAGNSVATAAARWDGQQWHGFEQHRGLKVSIVSSVAEFGGEVYVGGAFWTSAGNTLVDGIASWDGTSWSDVGGGLRPSGPGALQVYDDGTGEALYAAGSFTFAGGGPALYIARWDGLNWTNVGGSGLDNSAGAMAVFDDGTGSALYVGGSFALAGGISAHRIARWNGQAWSAVGPPTEVTHVRDLRVFDDGSGPRLYMLGTRPPPGVGSTLYQVHAWDGVSWTLIHSGPTPIASNLAVFDDGQGPALFASLTGAGGISKIHRWNGSAWLPFGTGQPGEPTFDIRKLGIFDDGFGPSLIALGSAGTVSPGIVARRNSQWYSFGAGFATSTPGPSLSALAGARVQGHNSLFVAGYFPSVNGQPTSGFAEWRGCPLCPADCNGDGVLNLADFGCFQTRFALADPRADCNGDGVLNLADFGCFQTRFALGCP